MNFNFQNIKQDILALLRRPIISVFAVLILMIAALTFFFKRETTVFYGIAENQEIIINNKNPVAIREIFVVAGQQVKRGERLLELSHSELEVKLFETSSLLKQKKAQFEMNRRFSSELKSLQQDSRSGFSNSGLKSPLEISIESMERELAIFTAEEKELHIVSQIDGIIGSVNFKSGEKVSPFTPILTLSTRTPGYIKGYVHEFVYNRVAIGELMNISSLSGGKNTITGIVISVGSRIVEYPPRLWRHPDMPTWGREVLLKIPYTNSFLMGEKVMIFK